MKCSKPARHRVGHRVGQAGTTVKCRRRVRVSGWSRAGDGKKVRRSSEVILFLHSSLFGQLSKAQNMDFVLKIVSCSCHARANNKRVAGICHLERRSTAVLVAVAALMGMANMHAISQEVARQGGAGEKGSRDHVQGATKICCGFVKRAATQKPIDQATSR